MGKKKKSKAYPRREIAHKYQGKSKARLSVRLTPQEISKIKRYADMSGRSITDYVVQRCLYEREEEEESENAGR